ncbi:MAG: hypothetical protein R6U84_08120 [Candidatus Cloacimonadales bacterium]
MKKITIFILCMFIFSGCIKQQEKPQSPQKITAKSTPLASWVTGLSSKYLVVGIARKSNDVEKMTESAKQMAAVMMNRNNSSFVIKNFASTEAESIRNSGKASFALNVGSSPEELKQVYNSLELVDYSMGYGYFFGLFGVDGVAAPSCSQLELSQAAPQWYREDYFLENEEKIIFQTKATSIDLKTAWEKAAETVRQKFAQYLVKEVAGRILEAEDQVREDIAMESRLMLRNLIISKSYFVPRLKNGTWRYDVYMEMLMEK